MKRINLICLAILLLAGCTPAATPTAVPTAVVPTAAVVRPSATAPVAAAPLNIGHRGARSLAPENTLASALKAYQAGADMWELDVAVTSDSQLVVLHDDTLERTSNAAQVFPDRRPWAVNTFSLDELRQLDFGSWFNQTDPFKQIAAGAVSQADQQSYVGEKIPTLREALEFTRDHNWRVNVEIKDATGLPGDAFVVQKTVELIQELKMEDQVVVSSFNHPYLQKVRQIDPKIKTAALVNYRVPDPLALLNGLGAKAFNPDLKHTDMGQIQKLLQAGDEVYVWTVNDASSIRQLAQANVTGIITDFPQQFKQSLDGQ